MNQEAIIYGDEIITTDEKTMTVYFWLKSKNRVDYDVFYDFFGASKRTFARVISTLRQSLDQLSIYKCHIIYNRYTQSYELIELY